MYGYVPISLKQITVNGGSIPYNCFRAFKYVEKIVLNDGIDYIGSHAFSDCEALTELIIPNSVTRVASSIASSVRCPIYATMEEEAKTATDIGISARCCTDITERMRIWSSKTEP